MRYVAPYPTHGRIGHQLSIVWLARLMSDVFDLQYQHAPFVDAAQATGPGGTAARWNEWLNLASGTVAFEPGRLGTVTYRGGWQAHHKWAERPQYLDYWRLCDGVPDEHVLRFEDFGNIWYRDVLAWQSAGLITEAVAGATYAWFQRQLDASPAYQRTAIPERDGRLCVRAYRRAPLLGEHLPPQHRPVSVEYLNEALRSVRAYRTDIDALVYQQSEIGDEGALDPAWRVAYCPDVYPQTFECVKDLIEADVAVTTVGMTSVMVQLYRYARRPTVLHPLCGHFPGVAHDKPQALARWLS